MATDIKTPASPSLGIIGFGAFGQLMAHHLGQHFRLYVHDPAVAVPTTGAMTPAALETVASQPVVVLAVPVSKIEAVARAIAAHVVPGALVLDVASVKVAPARLMDELLPAHVDIVATHPLFGPQSARAGIAGLDIAVCPVRGGRGRRVSAFLRGILELRVVMMTPEDHDREAAMVQGLTHLIARILEQMRLPRSRTTTRSFELLMAAVDMVRHDAPEVFEAIARANPFAAQVRQHFLGQAAALEAQLSGPMHSDRGELRREQRARQVPPKPVQA